MLVYFIVVLKLWQYKFEMLAMPLFVITLRDLFLMSVYKTLFEHIYTFVIHSILPASSSAAHLVSLAYVKVFFDCFKLIFRKSVCQIEN